MTWSQFWLGISSGVGIGSMYALVALSYTLVLAGSGVFNFFQGTSVMLGAVLSYTFGQAMGWPLLSTIAVIVAIGAAGALLVHLVGIAPLTRRAENVPEAGILTTLGLGLVVESIVSERFGTTAEPVPSYVSTSPIFIQGIAVQRLYIVMAVVTILIVTALELLARKTSSGIVLRATLEDPDGARLRGIRTNRVVLAVFVLAGGMASLAGFLIAPATSASPFVGHSVSLLAFVAMGLGGFGSFAGAVVGGLIVGLCQGLLPSLLGPNASLPILYVLILAVLTIRPLGLFGSRGVLGNAAVREV